MTFTHIWYWRKRLGARKGSRCRIVAAGAMNSILVEFESDGLLVVTSKWAVRKRQEVRE